MRQEPNILSAKLLDPLALKVQAARIQKLPPRIIALSAAHQLLNSAINHPNLINSSQKRSLMAYYMRSMIQAFLEDAEFSRADKCKQFKSHNKLIISCHKRVEIRALAIKVTSIQVQRRIILDSSLSEFVESPSDQIQCSEGHLPAGQHRVSSSTISCPITNPLDLSKKRNVKQFEKGDATITFSNFTGHSKKRPKTRISCETKIITLPVVKLGKKEELNFVKPLDENDEIESNKKQYLYYECQLVKVNKDRALSQIAKKQGKTLPEDEEEEMDFTRIIFNSNLQQMRTVLEQAKEKASQDGAIKNPIIFSGLKEYQAERDFEEDPTKPGSFRQKEDIKLTSSEYRGVSLNGKKWQVMVMGNNCKYFSGSIPYHKLAARIYDRFALQHFGLRSRINLTYRLDDFETLLGEIEEQVTHMLENENNNEPFPLSENDADGLLCPSDVIILRGTIPLCQL
ncbi:hypothetical protein FGO68_gene12408 [Halteria grandinella]|uniref:Uncharacterized protein n=1 Tax=Halteria grandinella TaxID=5974 RepID=A0A8J8T4W6_HALGN|nr:hypothetical protein FGO68_gene12408 [Halteria grandinella]